MKTRVPLRFNEPHPPESDLSRIRVVLTDTNLATPFALSPSFQGPQPAARSVPSSFPLRPRLLNLRAALFLHVSRTSAFRWFLVFVLSAFVFTIHGESVSICDVPSKLPAGLGLGSYSPPICFGYAGLQAGSTYTMKVWLLTPGLWYCASSQWCERTFSIDNSTGNNSQGSLEIIENMDVYAYQQFDWVVRLYDAGGNQVAWTEQYVDATTNAPPVLDPIGDQSGVTGQPITIALSGSDTDGEQVQFGASNLPAGGVFDTNTGVFTWTPNAAGVYGPAIFWAQDTGDGLLRDAEAVTFSIVDGPRILTQPQSQVAALGSSVVFTVVATSPTPLSFQWRFNGTNIANATATQLALANVTTSNAGGYSVVVSNSVASETSEDAILTVPLQRTPLNSIGLSLQELQDVMDEYHTNFQVYTDISAGGNHFHARGQLPDQYSAVGIFGSVTNQPHSGATCILCTFTNITDVNNGGFYFLNGILVSNAPLPYFGESIVAGTAIVITNSTGYDLTGAQQVTFWARGAAGGEQIEFFVGGVGRDPFSGVATQPFPDSMARFPAAGTEFHLTTNWQQFAINLSGKNLTNIMGGFGWFAEATKNPNGAAFYLDDIAYELSASKQSQRLNEPRFLRSYRTRPVQPDIFDSNKNDDIDFVLREVAFTYDNAIAILAFLADGTADSLRRAQLIGNAFVDAALDDRSYTDGRFRTAYASGDISLPPGWVVNGRYATVPVPGFYLEDPPRFFEVENVDVDTGNNAWAMIALQALYKRFGNTNYLAAAKRVGAFIETMRSDSAPFPSFRGGIFNAETASPAPRTYASTEHNLDIYASFSEMYRLTGDTQWRDGAALALQFVELMWCDECGCYLAGTTGGNPDARNQTPGQLPLDTQSWNVLAVPDVLKRHPNLLNCPEENHRNTHDGFNGFDFNDDRDGVWFEGTAQMAVAYAFAETESEVNQLRGTLQTAQQIPLPFGDGLGMPAASHDGVTSGFSFKLFLRPHVGATAWNIFAQLGFNPYYQTFRPTQVEWLGLDAMKRPNLRVVGQPGKSHVLQKSLDLTHWLAIGTNSSALGEITFVDPVAATNRPSFYRAMVVSANQ